jgi:carbon monoxide dehydrogenase subunit G
VRPAKEKASAGAERRITVVSVRKSFTIGRPIGEVFAFVTDPAKLSRWQSSAVEASLQGNGPMQTGSRLIERRSVMGRTIESMMEVVEYDPPRRFVVKTLSGPIPFQVSQELSEEDGATRIDVVVQGKPTGVFRFASRLVAGAVERQLHEDFARAKRLLESG